MNRNPKNQFGIGHGAPKGNRHAAKDRIWRRALNEELKKYEAEGIKPGEALNAIAKLCVSDALASDPDVRAAARIEIANRLDGKPTEHVVAEFTNALAEELSDEELLSIARGSGDRAVEEAGSPEDNSGLH